MAEEEDYLTSSSALQLLMAHPRVVHLCTCPLLFYTNVHCTLPSGNVAEKLAVHCSGLMVHPRTPRTPLSPLIHLSTPSDTHQVERLLRRKIISLAVNGGLQHARGHHIKIVGHALFDS